MLIAFMRMSSMPTMKIKSDVIMRIKNTIAENSTVKPKR